jgi:hypothetical protein
MFIVIAIHSSGLNVVAFADMLIDASVGYASLCLVSELVSAQSFVMAIRKVTHGSERPKESECWGAYTF